MKRAITALALMLLASTADAETVTIGASQYGTECSFPCTQRMQQVYEGDNFGTDPVVITSFNFFVGVQFTADVLFNVYLSQAATPVGSQVLDFSSNIGANYTFIGSLGVNGSLNGGDTVGLSGFSFNFDPEAGDLLIDLVNQNVSGLSSQQDNGQFVSGFSSDIYRVLSIFPGSTTQARNGYQAAYGLLTRFNYVEAAQEETVPEPATLALLGAGLLGLGWARRGRI